MAKYNQSIKRGSGVPNEIAPCLTCCPHLSMIEKAILSKTAWNWFQTAFGGEFGNVSLDTCVELIRKDIFLAYSSFKTDKQVDEFIVKYATPDGDGYKLVLDGTETTDIDNEREMVAI